MKSFKRDYNYTEEDKKLVNSLAVSLQQLGAFVACFFIWPVTHKIGRKYAIAACSLVFCIGAAIQTAQTHSKPAFYVGRVIAGLGLGGSSVVVPMFSSEMTPKEIRGQIGSFYQLMFTLGIFTSYWIDWGVARNFSKSDSSMWQIPVGLQMLWAGLLGILVFTLKESTRWLTAKGRHEEAWNSLSWIRADQGEATQAEMEEIRRGVELEAHAREGFRMIEMVQKGNLRRTLTAAAVFTAQQATGATAFAYYGPQYFNLLVNKGSENSLLLTAIFGAIKVAACLTFVIFVADNVGRRWVLTAGALFMAACQLSTAAVVKTHPARDGTVTSAGIATIALIYLFVIAYNFSWGPLPWPYVSEVSLPYPFPPRCAFIRSPPLTQASTDLPHQDPRARHRHRRRLAMALRLRLHPHHAVHDRQYQMGHLPALGPLRLLYRLLRLVLLDGDAGEVVGGDYETRERDGWEGVCGGGGEGRGSCWKVCGLGVLVIKMVWLLDLGAQDALCVLVERKGHQYLASVE